MVAKDFFLIMCKTSSQRHANKITPYDWLDGKRTKKDDKAGFFYL